MNGKIGVVIVNYNGEKYQNDCIDCILNQEYKNYKIIIVDNCSNDNSMKLLETNDEIIKIYNKENLGVAEGNNIGIRKSIEIGCEYTLLLNNDTTFDKTLFDKLVRLTSLYDVVVPKIYYYNTNDIWYGGGFFSKIRCSTKHLYYKKKDNKCRFKNFYYYAPTCCMLIKNSVFSLIGLMDKDYFLYYDDSDFCARLYERRIKIGFESNVRFDHLVSKSTGSNSKLSLYYLTRNKLIFMSKNKNLFNSFFLMVNKGLIYTRLLKYKIIKSPIYDTYHNAVLDYKNHKYGKSNHL